MAGHDRQIAPRTDLMAGYLGLIGGAIFIFSILYGIVALTNAKYANHSGEAKATSAVSFGTSMFV